MYRDSIEPSISRSSFFDSSEHSFVVVSEIRCS